MKSNELYYKTEEIVGKFKNGEERYKRSALFNRVVQMLARGCDPYDVMDSLINIADDTTIAFQQHLMRDTRPTQIGEMSKRLFENEVIEK